MKYGFIFGKFSPFHRGHVYLIEQAQQLCDVLTVLVCSTEEDEIPGWQRYYWVKSTFPQLDIRHFIGNKNKLSSYLKATPSGDKILFEGGETQYSFAEQVGFLHISIDPDRKFFPIRTQVIRKAPMAHWELLPLNVRPFYLKRVALVGPESCGKSYLAEQLALHFDTVFVEEYGRAYCEKFGMDSTELDFAHVAGGQLYREDEMALAANRLLFCDTDLIVTQIWSEVYFKGKCQPWIFWADHARRYDLYLLCAPDIPWVNDGLREFEGQRDWMFERLRQELDCRGLNYAVIQGGFEERTAAAVNAVAGLS